MPPAPSDKRKPAPVDEAVPDRLPDAISGVEALHGLHQRAARGFWLEAWGQVQRRPGAVFGLLWLGLVIAIALFGPFIASGSPLWVTPIDESVAGPAGLAPGEHLLAWLERRSPLIASLEPIQVVLGGAGLFGFIYWMLPCSGTRWPRVGRVLALLLYAAIATALASAIRSEFVGAYMPEWRIALRDAPWFMPAAVALPPLVLGLLMLPLPLAKKLPSRVAVLAVVGALAALVAAWKWTSPQLDYLTRLNQIEAGQVRAIYTLVPWSPMQGATERKNLPPGSSLYDPARRQVEDRFADQIQSAAREAGEIVPTTRALEQRILETPLAGEQLALYLATVRTSGIPDASVEKVLELTRQGVESGELATVADGFRLLDEHPDLAFNGWQFRFHSGTDSAGRDVLSQILHACRIAISIGLVSTGIATTLGVIIGSIMGYFGGWIDMLLMRVVEVFMAIPVLFLLVVAAGVLPDNLRSIYMMMAIIGFFRWHGAARFTRAEFLKLRNQDFVQSAKAAGLPLHSILFKHMLPNGVTPVLVESSFTVAAAILIESALSFLGYGAEGEPSWGALLSEARDPSSGVFLPWLAGLPGLAIFLTVFAYNLIGEALRDAIDPKLKKAAN